MLHGVTPKQFARELLREIREDQVATGAAALAFYLMLAAFPAAIFLLTLLPYLPIPHLEQAIMDLLRETLPAQAATLFTGTVREVTTQRNGHLLSFGLLFTIWSASSGMHAVMQQLNVTYDVEEGRPFWKVRATAVGLTLLFVLLVIGALALVVFGGEMQAWIGDRLGWSRALLALFATLRWVIIAVALMLGFATVYYFGPDVEQRFRFVTPGSVFGTLALGLASLGFRLYVQNFGRFGATYGSLGAVIVMITWLFLTGWVLLLGSELNALIEHYSRRGKRKGEKRDPEGPEPTGQPAVGS